MRGAHARRLRRDALRVADRRQHRDLRCRLERTLGRRRRIEPRSSGQVRRGVLRQRRLRVHRARPARSERAVEADPRTDQLRSCGWPRLRRRCRQRDQGSRRREAAARRHAGRRKNRSTSRATSCAAIGSSCIRSTASASRSSSSTASSTARSTRRRTSCTSTCTARARRCSRSCMRSRSFRTNLSSSCAAGRRWSNTRNRC